MKQINVFGAGAFGSALAISLARTGQDVCLIARNQDHAKAMANDRENRARLSGVPFPKSLSVGLNPSDGANINLLTVPTAALGELVQTHKSVLANNHAIACCKGVDLKTGIGPTGIISSVCPDAKTAFLSGPSFAVDIAAGLPTALTLATKSEIAGRNLQKALQFSSIRLYRSTDVLGVELGGALKNVIALAAGIAIGAGLGESARAALITRGFHEMKQFAEIKGASAETLSGLSGFGDLILTCTSPKSRNFSHGLALGKGEIPDQTKTVEGTLTARAVHDIAVKLGIEMPITKAVTELLAGKISINDSIATLLARPLKEE